jgi:hypothetical protein
MSGFGLAGREELNANLGVHIRFNEALLDEMKGYGVDSVAELPDEALRRAATEAVQELRLGTAKEILAAWWLDIVTDGEGA